jgi:hypothetical protein
VTSGEKRTYRNPFSFIGGSIALVLSLVICALPGTPVAARVLFLFAAAIFAWAALWVRLTTDENGASVYYLRTRRVFWPDVDEVMLHRRWGVPALVLGRGAGGVTVWAVAETIRGGGLGYCRRTTREVQATWSRRTGRPMPKHTDGPDLRR